MVLAAVNYHYVRSTYDFPYPSIYGLYPDQFRRQLDVMSGMGEFISPTQLSDAITQGTSLPERSILVTFDDGLREQYEVALPILDEMGIPAAFFVNTKPIDEKIVATVHQLHLLRANVPHQELVQAFEASCDVQRVHVSAVDTDVATAQYIYDTPEVARFKYLINVLISAEDAAASYRPSSTNISIRRKSARSCTCQFHSWKNWLNVAIWGRTLTIISH